MVSQAFRQADMHNDTNLVAPRLLIHRLRGLNHLAHTSGINSVTPDSTNFHLTEPLQCIFDAIAELFYIFQAGLRALGHLRIFI